MLAGVPITEIAAITFTEKAAAELRHRLRVELADRSPRADAGGAGIAAHWPSSTTPRSARCTPSPAGCWSSSPSSRRCRRASRCSTRWRARSPSTSAGPTSSRRCSTTRRRSASSSCASTTASGSTATVRLMAEDFQANWDLVERPCRADPAPHRRQPDADAWSPVRRHRRHRRAARRHAGTPWSRGIGQLGHASPARRRSARCSTCSPTLAAIKPGELGQQDELEAPRCARRARSTRCAPPRQALAALAPRASSSPSTRSAGSRSARCCGASCSTPSTSAAPPGSSSSTTCSCSPAGCSPTTPACAPRSTSATHADPARRVPGHRPDPARDRRAAHRRARRSDRPTGSHAAPAARPAVHRRRPEAEDLPVPPRRHRPVPPAPGPDRRHRATLSANFRSTAAVIDWVNDMMGRLIDARTTASSRRTSRSTPAAAVAAHAGSVHVLGADGARRRAERRRPAAPARPPTSPTSSCAPSPSGWPVARDAARRACSAPCRLGDIAILLPARTSLPALQVALAERGIPYRAENSSLVYAAPGDPRPAAGAARRRRPDRRAGPRRRAAHPAVRLQRPRAVRVAGRPRPALELAPGGARRRSPTTRSPTGCARSARLAERIPWSTPAELLAALVDERGVLELALATRHGRDVWRRVRFVIDQARAWSEAGGHGVRRYLAWTGCRATRAGRRRDHPARDRPRRRAGDDRPRRQGPGVPDHDRLRHDHQAPGIDGPGGWCGRPARGRWPASDDPVYEAFRPVDEQMGDAERRRLLYVACTRAQDHLVVSLHRKPPPDRQDKHHVGDAAGRGRRAPAHATYERRPPAPACPRTAAEPGELPWADEERLGGAPRSEAIAAAAVPSVLSATAARPPPRAAAVDDPALRKDAVDLDRCPGSAAATAPPSAAPCTPCCSTPTSHRCRHRRRSPPRRRRRRASSGWSATIERAGPLGAVARPIVRAAVDAEHWRELFVATALGEQVVEGYIDLLVRTPSAASSSSTTRPTSSPARPTGPRLSALRPPAGRLRRRPGIAARRAGRRRRPGDVPHRTARPTRSPIDGWAALQGRSCSAGLRGRVSLTSTLPRVRVRVRAHRVGLLDEGHRGVVVEVRRVDVELHGQAEATGVDHPDADAGRHRRARRGRRPCRPASAPSGSTPRSRRRTAAPGWSPRPGRPSPWGCARRRTGARPRSRCDRCGPRPSLSRSPCRSPAWNLLDRTSHVSDGVARRDGPPEAVAGPAAASPRCAR